MDINGNGRLDFVTGGWWGDTLRWRENPGDPNAEWPEHIIAQTGNVETTRGWDVDGDGQIEIVPNTPGGPLVVYKLDLDEKGVGTGAFTAHVIRQENQGHGLGFGDINGNGRGDFVLINGWLEAPENPLNGTWIFHQDFNLGSTGIPILVEDVNGNGTMTSSPVMVMVTVSIGGSKYCRRWDTIMDSSTPSTPTTRNIMICTGSILTVMDNQNS